MSGVSASNHTPAIKRRRGKKWTRDDTELSLLALPTSIWYLLFCYLPMFGVVLPFLNFKIVPGSSFFQSILHSEWVGFENFKYLFIGGNIWILLRNTIGYNIIFIVQGIVVPVTLAIIISMLRNQRGAKTYQTMMFFPHFLSWVVVSYFVYAFLNAQNGIVVSMQKAAGLPRTNFYRWPEFWVWAFPALSLWKGVGNGMVVYLAAITGIDHSLYEAAVIDGASKPQQVRYITLPSLKPMMIMMFILNVGRIFYSDFGLFYQVTQGIPRSIYNVSATIDTFVYQSLRSSMPYGMIAAPTFIQSVACCITILIANAIIRRIEPENALI